MKAEEENRKALLPGLKEDVDEGLAHLVKLNNPRLLDLLKYHFGGTTKRLPQIKIKETHQVEAHGTRSNSRGGATGGSNYCGNYSGLDTYICLLVTSKYVK
jgi:hypothetical protein